MTIRATTTHIARCDQHWFDSAALGAGHLMSGAAVGSMGCHVEAGPFTSLKAARQTLDTLGWFVRTVKTVSLPPGVTEFLWVACPSHAFEATAWWSEVDRKAASQ